MILRLLKYPAVLSNEPKRDYTELFTVDKKYQYICTYHISMIVDITLNFLFSELQFMIQAKV